MTHAPGKSEADFQGDFDNVARALGLSAAAAEGFAAGWQASQDCRFRRASAACSAVKLNSCEVPAGRWDLINRFHVDFPADIIYNAGNMPGAHDGNNFTALGMALLSADQVLITSSHP